ncbi:MAG: acetyl-CoA C-acyltransferase FadI [Deltaproteobacteria bacterium]|nr:acetyl-CoA C-acyltransferase FadI [Deltaproteobacteria bacterium]
MAKAQHKGKGGRVAIVAGLRTPFVKQATEFQQNSPLELASAVVKELVIRTGIDPNEISQIVYGAVGPSLTHPNIAREIIFQTNLPRKIEGFSVVRACATSLQAIASGAEAIMAGNAEVVIAGGVDSASDVLVGVSRKMSHALLKASKAKDLQGRVKALLSLGLKDLLPVPPALKEASTGLSMGESAEKMAKENKISRGAQDELAHRSHVRAAKAWAEGKFKDEVMTTYAGADFSKVVREDNTYRKESDLAAYAKLSPVFDRKHGTVTAANSSPLTDGAAAVMIMSEEKAKALGIDPMGYLRSWAFAALDPNGQMLLGPAYASPIALERAGMTLKDMDLVDMHEAFAAQILSNLQKFASKDFANNALGRPQATGDVDMDKFNVNGGSIALGHPFAATAARMVTQTLNELKRRGKNTGLVTLCAAGGLGAAAVLERE